MDRWQTFNNLVYFALKLIYVNVLWILFTLVGLVAFGIFPATGALFTVTKKLMDKEKNLKIFQTFWNAFRKDFFVLNGVFLFFLIIGYFFYFNVKFLSINEGKLQFLYPVLALIGTAYFISLLFFFPVFTHFKLRFWQYLKQTFLIAITSPKELILIVLTGAIILTVIYFLPGIIPLFLGSVFAYISTVLSHKAFEKVRLRKNV